MSMSEVEIREDKIIEIINKLQDNKVAGIDDVNSSFLKGSMHGIVRPLYVIFNESLRTGVVPEDWKAAT